MSVLDAKIVLLGASMVGKTSIVNRVISGIFESDEQPTVGACFSTKTVEIEGVQVNMQIWDTAGQERFRSLAPMYYHNAVAAVLVYDCTNFESLNEAKRWADELIQHCGKDQLKYVVGNKIDLVEQRSVEDAQGQAVADSLDGVFFETSALTGKGIDNLFAHLADSVLHKLLDQRREKSESPKPAEADANAKKCC